MQIFNAETSNFAFKGRFFKRYYFKSLIGRSYLKAKLTLNRGSKPFDSAL